MSYSESRSSTVVRRKGKSDICATVDRDGREVIHSGDRRTRQIARRHWLACACSGWCSNGGSYKVVTSLLPGKGEQLVRKPKNSGGSMLWLKKADGNYRIGSQLMHECVA